MLDWITNWIETLGYIGIFSLMVLEHLFPPIPSEVVMPLSGFASSRSDTLSLWLVVVVGSAGSLLGASAWYALGWWVKHEQMMKWADDYGKWLALDSKDIQKAIDFFHRSGGNWIVGLGRIVPGVRTYVSVPAGLTHMPLIPYLLYSAIGTALWTGLLAIAGYVLGDQFDKVQKYISPISKGMLIMVGLGAIVWLLWRRRKR
jgi:membrane protein DedA with SNARE-associated domain